MKKGILLICGLVLAASNVTGQEFINLDFEHSTVTDQGTSVPGWRHSNGSTTGFPYYGHHTGIAQWHVLVRPFSPEGGNYAVSFACGRFRGRMNSPHIQAYIAQVGRIPKDAAFIQLQAEGADGFKVLIEDVEVPMVSLGNKLYQGDVRGFAGGIGELKIVNLSPSLHKGLKIDNISFVPLVPAEVWWQGKNGTIARWEFGLYAAPGEFGSSTLYSSTALTNSFGSDWKAVSRVDFNGDESSDILFQNDTGLLGVQLMTNNSILGVVPMENNLSAKNWRVFSAADMNNDQSTDLLFQNRVSGRLAVQLMDGTNSMGTTIVTNSQSTQGIRAIAARDFNDDDVADILIQDKSQRLVVWLGPDLESTAVLRDGFPVGTGWTVGNVVDRVLNDGSSGILFHHVDGRVGLWRMNKTNFVEAILLPRSVGAAWSMVGAK